MAKIRTSATPQKTLVSIRRISILLSLCMVFLFLGSYVWYTSTDDSVQVLGGISMTNRDRVQLEREIRSVTRGYPIDAMVPYIMEKDPKVAAFLVSIAKKESNLGKRSPKLDGRDCFNYWGYRGLRERMGTGGHTCFDSPEDAVDTVAKRIENLIEDNIDTPNEMIVWKCGSSCEGHSGSSVAKWIADVNLFFKKFIPGKAH